VKIFLANPRGFCAGVVRAIRIVEAAIERYGAPIYVRHEIVHNRHVQERLSALGAVFVEELDAVPDNVPVVFSAHGVARSVWDEAQARNLTVIDATCPLVTKVHLEVAKHARASRTVFVIGHRDHPEVIGTVGHYHGSGDAHVEVIETEAEARTAQAVDIGSVAYVTQTTLSTDSTAGIVAILRERFPQLMAPAVTDICYATQSRQQAVRALAKRSDCVIVVGARHSSNSMRLVEVARASGAPARLTDCAAELDQSWFYGMQSIGITAGASAPECLVTEIVDRFRSWWPDLTEESIGEPETVHFRMPSELAAMPRRYRIGQARAGSVA
jgi:4-hydroxy-3-methylbut-2-en-1-yl diphosphate reductase